MTARLRMTAALWAAAAGKKTVTGAAVSSLTTAAARFNPGSTGGRDAAKSVVPAAVSWEKTRPAPNPGNAF